MNVFDENNLKSGKIQWKFWGFAALNDQIIVAYEYLSTELNKILIIENCILGTSCLSSF